MNISNFNNVKDYLPILSGATLTDIFFMLLLNLGLIKSNELKKWYLQYGLSAVLADVLILVIGVIITRFLYYHVFSRYSLLLFIVLALGVQLTHDSLFTAVFSLIPRGSSKIMDLFKDYAKESGFGILIADACMVIMTILLATYFSSFDVNTNIIILISSVYLIPYFLHSVKLNK
jgi:hypothetical protein